MYDQARDSYGSLEANPKGCLGPHVKWGDRFWYLHANSVLLAQGCSQLLPQQTFVLKTFLSPEGFCLYLWKWVKDIWGEYRAWKLPVM